MVIPTTVNAQQTKSAKITAPPRVLKSLTVIVGQDTNLSGTWNFQNNFGNVSGTIVFGTQQPCRASNEKDYGLSGNTFLRNHWVGRCYKECC